MLTRTFVKQRFIQLPLLLGIMLLLLAACDSGNGNQTNAGNATPTPQIVTSANALIRHTPSGTLQLAWDHTSHVLTVQVALTGFVPNSVHPAHIHAGSCRDNNGKVIYALKNVVADSIGFANSITKISDVTTGIPANGWYVNVHNGPGLSPETQMMPISCADVTNTTSATTASQATQATLGTTVEANQASSGNVQLVVKNKQLTVQVSMQGLAASSTHAEDIHAGSCASQGKVVYALKPLNANASGNANTTTVIPDVAALPQSGWYLNVHLTTDLARQTGNDVIACGDIIPAH